nr:TonB-dependent receptor [uncultured Desulfuromonas sp.]
MLLKKLLYFSILSSIACVLPVYAAQSDDATLVLDPIVVTASRTPETLSNVSQSIEIIDRSDIANSAANSVADLLEYVSGVDVRQRGTYGIQSDIYIRGGGSEQTLILLNGIRLSNPQTGHHNMDIPVSLQDIERIEVIKGPGSKLYGANAMAGIINIITRRPETSDISGEVKMGDYDYLSETLQAGFSTGPVNHRLSLGQQYSSGFDNDEPTGFNIRTLNYQGETTIYSNRLEFGAGLVDKKFGASRFYFDAPDQKEHTRSFIGHIAADSHWLGVDWRPQWSINRHEDTYRYLYGTTWYKNETDTTTHTVQITGNKQSRFGLTSFGIGYEREEVDSSNLGDHDRSNRSLFVNHKLPVNDYVTLGAGLSAIHYSDWGWEYWPGADALVTLAPHLRWFSSVAKSFRIPTYTEMYYNTPSNIGDANLEPEEAWSYETGLRWQKKQLTMSASVFRRDADNLIDWARTANSDPWQVQNLSETTTTGFEWSADIRHPLSSLPWLKRISAGYSYLDRDVDSKGLESRYTLNNLRHQVHGALYVTWFNTVEQVIKGRWQERLLGDSSWVVDTRFSYLMTDQLELSVEMSNLFDEHYIESGDAPMPGRWIMVGMRMEHSFLE